MCTPKWLALALIAFFALGTVTSPGEALAQKKKSASATKKKKKAKRKPARKKAKKKKTVRTAKTSSSFLVNQLLKQGVIGVRVGFDVSSMDCDCDVNVDYSGSLGFIGGLSYDRSINRHFAYRGHAAYITKSYDYELAGGEGDDRELETDLSQVKLGGQLSLRYDVNQIVTVYIIGGPFLAFNTSVRSQMNGQRNKDEADAYNVFDLGFTFGVGSYFAVSKGRGLMGSAELSYSNGMVDRIDRASNADEDEIEESGLFNLLVGIHF